MKQDILKFIEQAHRKFRGLEAYYIPEDDLYVIMKNGKALSNFTSTHFYQLPQYYRLREWEGILQGLDHNMGEKTVKTEQIKGLGKKIILNG